MSRKNVTFGLRPKVAKKPCVCCLAEGDGLTMQNNRRRTNAQQLTCKMVWSFSFYSLLFSFILFYSLLFSFILFYSLLFSFILFYSLLFSFILFYSLLFSFILFESKAVVKPLNSKTKSWRNISEKL